jgi:hypothetical protein
VFQAGGLAGHAGEFAATDIFGAGALLRRVQRGRERPVVWTCAGLPARRCSAGRTVRPHSSPTRPSSSPRWPPRRGLPVMTYGTPGGRATTPRILMPTSRPTWLPGAWPSSCGTGSTARARTADACRVGGRRDLWWCNGTPRFPPSTWSCGCVTAGSPRPPTARVRAHLRRVVADFHRRGDPGSASGTWCCAGPHTPGTLGALRTRRSSCRSARRPHRRVLDAVEWSRVHGRARSPARALAVAPDVTIEHTPPREDRIPR